jgi:hypothetical protein
MKRFPRKSAKNAPRRQAGARHQGMHRTVFSHPDFLAAIADLPTVGSGIGPDLLTFR